MTSPYDSNGSLHESDGSWGYLLVGAVVDLVGAVINPVGAVMNPVGAVINPVGAIMK